MDISIYLPEKQVCGLSFSGKKPVWKPSIFFKSPRQISLKLLIFGYISGYKQWYQCSLTAFPVREHFEIWLKCSPRFNGCNEINGFHRGALPDKKKVCFRSVMIKKFIFIIKSWQGWNWTDYNYYSWVIVWHSKVKSSMLRNSFSFRTLVTQFIWKLLLWHIMCNTFQWCKKLYISILNFSWAWTWENVRPSVHPSFPPSVTFFWVVTQISHLARNQHI